MISSKLAKEIAHKMEQLEVAETYLKELSSNVKTAQTHIQIIMESGKYNERTHAELLAEGFHEVKSVLEFIINRHKEYLELLNAQAVKEAQSSSDEIKIVGDFPDNLESWSDAEILKIPQPRLRELYCAERDRRRELGKIGKS